MVQYLPKPFQLLAVQSHRGQNPLFRIRSGLLTSTRQFTLSGFHTSRRPRDPPTCQPAIPRKPALSVAEGRGQLAKIVANRLEIFKGRNTHGNSHQFPPHQYFTVYAVEAVSAALAVSVTAVVDSLQVAVVTRPTPLCSTSTMQFA